MRYDNNFSIQDKTAMQQHFYQAESTLQKGALYVVATPIGNLSDLSLRALAVLKNADMIFAEDTRVTAKLLTAYGLHRPLFSIREHNERSVAEKIIQHIEDGKIIAQVSDAGTPAVCDPGAKLVALVRSAGLPVYPIAGACAAITALSAAGIESDNFYFGGFLPPKSNERQNRLTELNQQCCAVIVYETPHRISGCLKDMFEIMPKRKITIARELTKSFETFLCGTADELLGILSTDKNQAKGEMVLILHPAEKTQGTEIALEKILNALIDLPTKQAAQIAAQITDLGKKELYEMLLKIKK